MLGESYECSDLQCKQAHDSIINTIDGCGGMSVEYGAPELVTGSRAVALGLGSTR